MEEWGFCLEKRWDRLLEKSEEFEILGKVLKVKLRFCFLEYGVLQLRCCSELTGPVWHPETTEHLQMFCVL